MLGGHKHNLVCTRTQEKGAVTPQKTDTDLSGSVQEPPLEAWFGGVVACCRVGGSECGSTCMGSFEGGHHYLHYLHHSLKWKWKWSYSVVSNSLWVHGHGILQAGILEWVAISFSRGSSRHRDRTQVSCTAGRLFTAWAIRGFQSAVIAINFLLLLPFEECIYITSNLGTESLKGENLKSYNWKLCPEGHGKIRKGRDVMSIIIRSSLPSVLIW